MRYFSLFSGIGGFELGIMQSNAYQPECVGYSEIDKYAVQIYQKQFPNHKNYGDITKIKAEELPDFELLVGGFPCQSFSVAGKRGGFKDTRGTLFFEIARIIREKQPRLLLLENVKGLLSHDQGATLFTIITTLTKLGYHIQWQVINSKNHGVPQNRDRIFIIGHLRGTSRPEVFPLGENEESDSKTNQNGQRWSNTLTGRSASGTNARGTYIKQLNDPKMARNRVYGIDGISSTLQTGTGGGHIPFIAPEKSKIRRLTPTECERLQGFPDGWTKYGLDKNSKLAKRYAYCGGSERVEISDTQRYKTLGNAVTVNVVRDIVKKIY